MTATSVIPSRAGEAASSRSPLSHFYICNYSAERYLDLPPQLPLSRSALQPNYISEMTFPLAAARPGSPRQGEERDAMARAFVLPNKKGLFFPSSSRAGCEHPAGSALRLCGEPAGTDRSQLESRGSGSCQIMGANLAVEFINSHLHCSISVLVHQG